MTDKKDFNAEVYKNNVKNIRIQHLYGNDSLQIEQCSCRFLLGIYC